MIICPDCAATIATLGNSTCECGWSPSILDGIPVMLATADRVGALSIQYHENYDTIANDDIRGAVMDETFVRNLASNLLRHVGSVVNLDVCDIGVGKGYLAKSMSLKARSVVAVDIARAYLAPLRNAASFTA